MDASKKILFLLITIFLLSCEKDEDSIDMSKLLDYRFLYASHSITTNMDNEIIESVYDTTIYSFFENDTIIAIKKVYESIEDIFEYDTISYPYYIKEFSVKFSRAGEYQCHDFLLAYNWDVVSISEEYLKIKLIGPYSYSGDEQLQCISK